MDSGAGRRYRERFHPLCLPAPPPVSIIGARPGDARPPYDSRAPNIQFAGQVKPPLSKIPLNSTDFLLPSPDRILRNVAAMNKAELIESIQAALGKDATKRAADEALEAVLSSIAKGVKNDQKVQIIGFGTFEVKKRAARQGRNPKTGEAMKIAASKSVGFKPSSVLKGSL